MEEFYSDFGLKGAAARVCQAIPKKQHKEIDNNLESVADVSPGQFSYIPATDPAVKPKIKSQIQKEDQSSEPDAGDLAELAKTCQSIIKMVKNISQYRDSRNPECQRYVRDMQEELREIIHQEDIPDGRIGDRKKKNKHKRYCKKNPRVDVLKLAPSLKNRKWSSTESSDEVSLVDETDTIRKLMHKLDTRIVPKPEKYDSSSGRSLSDFLKEFEEYCSCSFRGSREMWIPELGRFLDGDIQGIYKSLRTSSSSYDEIRRDLLNWQKNDAENLEREIRRKFDKATIKVGESLKSYATRLEQAFRRAHPGRDVEKSKTLKNKFLDSIPKSLRKQFSATENVYMLLGQKITWLNLVTLVGRIEQDNATTDASADEIDSTKHELKRLPLNYVHAVQSDNRSWNASAPEWRPRDASPSPVRGSCFHCGKTGHVQSGCRKLNRLCFACGSANHRIANCPERKRVVLDSEPQFSSNLGERRVRFSRNDRQGSAGMCQSRSDSTDHQLN